MAQEQFVIEYRFRFKDRPEQVFTLRLRKPELQLETSASGVLPGWTRLEHHQCPNCPLSPATTPHCPVAVNLIGLMDAFMDCLSTEPADITVRVESREYTKRAPVQYGVSSLMGLMMATSGCPLLSKLRPMVQTHLPFATIEETIYRAVSMYLLAQYFRYQKQLKPDWDLEHLVELFEQIGQVNQAFSRRLVSINPKDASLNALANLDCFAMVTAFSITKDNLRELEPVFQAYLTPKAG